MRPRPELHETEIESEMDYYETETETKKLYRDHIGLETLTSLAVTVSIQPGCFCGGAVWASDFRSSGRGFDSRPGRNQVT